MPIAEWLPYVFADPDGASRPLHMVCGEPGDPAAGASRRGGRCARSQPEGAPMSERARARSPMRRAPSMPCANGSPIISKSGCRSWRRSRTTCRHRSPACGCAPTWRMNRREGQAGPRSRRDRAAGAGRHCLCAQCAWQWREDARIDLASFIDSIAYDYQDTGESRDRRRQVQGTVQTKPHALRRILSNFIDNALKFAGAAEISVERRDGKSSSPSWIAVQEFPTTMLDAAMQPFYRLEQSRNRETGGTGLGLAIAQQLATAQSAGRSASTIARAAAWLRSHSPLTAQLEKVWDVCTETVDAPHCYDLDTNRPLFETCRYLNWSKHSSSNTSRSR
jgi:hypothetical protein